jgi:hypothetical protein
VEFCRYEKIAFLNIPKVKTIGIGVGNESTQCYAIVDKPSP